MNYNIDVRRKDGSLKISSINLPQLTGNIQLGVIGNLNDYTYHCLCGKILPTDYIEEVLALSIEQYNVDLLYGEVQVN